MKIKNLQITNFKSFNNFQVELGDFNVIIGANASGKSNFVQIFRFIRDIARDGLENAISLQGGIEYFSNINLKDNQEFSLSFTLEPHSSSFFGDFPEEDKIMHININQLTYQVFFQMLQNYQELTKTIQDELYLKIEKLQGKSFKLDDKYLASYKIKIENNQDFNIETDIDHLQTEDRTVSFLKSEIEKLRLQLKYKAKFVSFLSAAELEEKILNNLVIESSFTQNKFTEYIQKELNSIHVFDFDTKLSKKIFTVNSKIDLEEDGSNLVILLKKVLADTEQRRNLINLASYVLPFINELKIEKILDKFLMFNIEEKYKNNNYQIPSSLLSDGTINVIAIILALYFNKPDADSMIIIEEPEKNIHPSVMSKLVELMKEVSLKKQVIVTTHSPQIVKYTGVENLLLMTRDREGFSQIVKPANSKEVQTFLHDEIGVDDLYTHNLLDIGV